jgi:cytochrome b-561 domain-containing protein 2
MACGAFHSLSAIFWDANYTTQTFGLVSFLWLLFQVVIGGGSVWFKGAAFGGGAKAKSVWKYHRLSTFLILGLSLIFAIHRLSGYLLFPLLLLTAHLGGGWSHWGNIHVERVVRISAYSVAPVLVIAAVYVRVRYGIVYYPAMNTS